MGRFHEDLKREWAAIAAGPDGRRALRRWQACEAALAGFHSLDDVLAAAHRPDDPAANDVLRPLLRLAATDPLARRCLLQALLPALAGLCQRHPSAGDDPDERLAVVLTLALERIQELAGSDVAYPAAAVAWRVGDHLRRAGRLSRRWPVIPTAALGTVLAGGERGRSPSEELAALLVDGVRRGRLRRGDAALVYTTRVVGVPCHVLAAARGVDPAVLRTRRRRAEQRVVSVAADDWC